MKRTWFAGALLLALLAAGIIISHSIGTCTSNVIEMIGQAESCAKRNDFSSAESACVLASEEWAKQQFLLAAFLRHDEPDQVETCLAQLCSYAQTEDNDEFLAMCAEVRKQLLHIREMELPTLRNIL